MGKKSTSSAISAFATEAPDSLKNHAFYGVTLDEYQEQFRDAIWSKDKTIIFCNAKAGSGKTFVATGTANLLVQYGRYEGICYICSPYGEGKQGYLPGSIQDKSEVYFEPFYQAMVKCGINPMTSLTGDMCSEKNGTAYIDCCTHTFLRGTTFENKVIIVDEAQNYQFPDLKKTLTRFSDNCKIIVIGHDQQSDLDRNDNAFVRYLNHFGTDDRCAVCELKKNYRGWVSSFADELM